MYELTVTTEFADSRPPRVRVRQYAFRHDALKVRERLCSINPQASTIVRMDGTTCSWATADCMTYAEVVRIVDFDEGNDE